MNLEHLTIKELYSNVRKAQAFVDVDSPFHTHTHSLTHTHTHTHMIMLRSITFIILAQVTPEAIMFNDHTRKVLD
jgi:hypothetical protein